MNYPLFCSRRKPKTDDELWQDQVFLPWATPITAWATPITALGHTHLCPGPHPSLPGPHPSLPGPHPSLPGPHPSLPGPHPSLPGPHPSLHWATPISALGHTHLCLGHTHLCLGHKSSQAVRITEIWYLPLRIRFTSLWVDPPQGRWITLSEAPCPRQTSSNQLGSSKVHSNQLLCAWGFLGYLSGSFWWPQKENKHGDWQQKRNSVIQILNVYRAVWIGPWKILLIPVEILFFFLTACYYRLSTKWKWKKYEWVGVRGIIACPSNFPPMSCMSRLQSSGFCSLWFLLHSFGGKMIHR